MMPNEGATVIGRSMKISGELSGTGDLLVDGEVEGTVRLLSSKLTVRVDGIVKAGIVAQDVTVLGHLEGEVHATGRVDLRDGAVVYGNVYSARLSIEEGATLRGSIDPTKVQATPVQEVVASKTASVQVEATDQ